MILTYDQGPGAGQQKVVDLVDLSLYKHMAQCTKWVPEPVKQSNSVHHLKKKKLQ